MSERRHHGVHWLDDGHCRICLWAPGQQVVRLHIDERPDLPSVRAADGWHQWELADVTPGALYEFELTSGQRVPDPASGFQPLGVHGPSELLAATDYCWSDAAWSGRPWRQAVIYELHIGTFTPEGTFRGAIEKLDQLQHLGVTALQLMPVAQFAGTRNWGYDGVLPYACAASYGRPEDLKALVDAAHARGLMVLLDVVYNHFGPEGNYLGLYAPAFFSPEQTPWGPALNFDGVDCRPVREFFLQNAVHWLQRFHFDGLRLDAVHTIVDRSPQHFLEELAGRVHAALPARHVHLTLENLSNQAGYLQRSADRAPQSFAAQWNDDVHHALHVAATREGGGYYADFATDGTLLGRALAEGFAFQGQYSAYRQRQRGQPSASLPPESFIAFLQNHDQIGNRWRGERIDRLLSLASRRAAAAAYLLLPQIPMLFMGEEWDAPEPFAFFCDFAPELAAAVRRGRIDKCARLDPRGAAADMADPNDVATFQAARLDWTARQAPAHAAMLDWYTRILGVRNSQLLPLLYRLEPHGGDFQVHSERQVSVQWRGEGCVLTLDLNLSAQTGAALPPRPGRQLWLEGAVDPQHRPQAWTTRWTVWEAADERP